VKTVLAILVWTLSLFGIEVGSHIRVDHIRAQNTDVLTSRVVARPASTRVECVRSASGQCYYTVFPDACTPASASQGVRCNQPIGHFALAKGERRQVATLANVRVCVRADAAVARPDCD
jgi:hypothetical protein